MSNVVTLRKEVEPKRLMPVRPKNIDLRTREFLKEAEVEQLITAAKSNRHGLRDSTMILLAFKHGLRVSELVNLKWDSVDFDRATLFVRRVKNGTAGVHPLEGPELRQLRALQRQQKPRSEYLFLSERGDVPISSEGFARMLTRTAKAAGMKELQVHPHALRHSTGYALINRGVDIRTLQAFMGHRNVQHTIAYAQLAPGKFRGIWTKR